MKKIVLIFRKKNKHGFSIEELFHSIYIELNKNYAVYKYEMRSFKYFFLDVINLWRLKADIYHVTGDVHYVASVLPLGKVVLTVLDVGHLKNDLKGLKKLIFKIFWYTLPLMLSKQITVISKKTYIDLLELFNVNKNKLSIVDCCYGSDINISLRKFNKNCPNLLQIGTHRLKNIYRVVEALEGLNCVLTIIGKLDHELKEYLIQKKINYKNYFSISRQEILNQFSNADIVIFISLEEGFGIPVLEAQAAGKPLITSNIAPMSDNAGLGACLVDPRNIEEIRNAIVKITNDENFRKKIVLDGLQNVKRFSVENITKIYSNIYEKKICNL